MKYLLFPLRLIQAFIYFWPALLGSIIGILFSPVIGAMTDSKGNLPYFLKWFETVDATMYDTMWVNEHPTWSKWLIATTWEERNPFYSGLHAMGILSPVSESFGNTACDSSNSTGAALFISDSGVFQINIVWKLPLVSWCFIHSFGWNIKSNSVTTGGDYIMAPIRTYNYTGK